MRTILITTLTFFAFGAAFAQRPLTYRDIESGKFSAKTIAALRSTVDGEHYTAITADSSSIVRYRYDTGAVVDTIFSNRWVGPTFQLTDYTLSADEKLVMLPTAIEPIYRHSARCENWIYDLSTKTFKQLSGAGKQLSATFSPDGTKAAFVRDNNIFVTDLLSGVETRITADGAEGDIINGQCDWVYEEEFGFDRAYQWSSASDAIAYYRFDQSRVKTYYMPLFDQQTYPQNYSFKYPKAGETNSTVSIRIFSLTSLNHSIVDIGQNPDQYIPRIEWTGRTGELAVHRVNRAQNRYDLLLYNSAMHSVKTLFNESSTRYIDRIDQNKVFFIPAADKFIVLSERDGWRHLYLYDMNGKFIRQITKGAWEVLAIDALDVRKGKVYFTAATPSPLCRQPFVMRYDRNNEPTTLPSAQRTDGTYSVAFSSNSKYFTQRFSSDHTPTITTVHNSASGALLRTLEDNRAVQDSLKLYLMPQKRYIELTAADGKTKLNGYLLLPADFDSTKCYPLLMSQYSGPGSQMVAHKWQIGWEYALPNEGFIVACVDGRGTGFRGVDFRSCTYRDLGNIETQDQIAAAKELGALPFIDSARIGIWGWSYGGFMALNSILKGSDIFSTAIAIAPVTSWRYYDTIYTEIYNGTPQDNPQGYDQNAPINFAHQLKGKLLIVHGTADDNVHIQNTYDMITALNRANKQHHSIIYPDRNHSMGGDRHRLMYECIDFLKSNL